MAEGKTVEAAAAAAGMSARSAHTWKAGTLPSQAKQPRHWRTREDAFATVWDAEVALANTGALRALEAVPATSFIHRYADDTQTPIRSATTRGVSLPSKRSSAHPTHSNICANGLPNFWSSNRSATRELAERRASLARTEQRIAALIRFLADGRPR